MQLNDRGLLKDKAYLNGVWANHCNNLQFDVINPANGELITTVPNMGQQETQAVIQSANESWPAWRALLAKERSSLLRHWFDLIMQNQQDLAKNS